MRIREVYNSKIPKLLSVGAIVLYPFIFYAEKDPGDETRYHEWIHVAQIKKVGFFSFYLSYLFYYWANRMIGMDKHDAYLHIPYELQAYEDTKEFFK